MCSDAMGCCANAATAGSASKAPKATANSSASWPYVAYLSAVKTLKLAEVERWQAAEQERCARGEGQQPAPDLSFLLYASAEVMPISRVAALAEEYDRLCAALPADDA